MCYGRMCGFCADAFVVNLYLQTREQASNRCLQAFSPVAVADDLATVDVPLAMPTDRAVPVPEETVRDEATEFLPAAVECDVARPPVDTATACAEARSLRSSANV
jgi:hypothetical protein